MTLKDELTDIQGVGDKRAEQIIAIVEEHNTGTEALERALEFLERDKPHIAKDVLESALDG